MATDKRQFLDYEGLASFWNGIKGKFADVDAFATLSNTVDGFADTLDTQSELLAEIDSYVKTLSPLQADSYTKALEMASTHRLGSIIYVSNTSDVQDKAVGPYMITNGRALMYINLNPVEGDIDTEAVMNALSNLQQTVNGHSSRLERLEETVYNNSGISYKVVDNPPLNDSIEDGVIYFVKNDDTTYTEYMGITINGNPALEKIGVGVTDIESYINDKLEPINQNIQKLSENLSTLDENFDTRAKTVILADLQSYNENSIGTTLRITEAQIDNLLKQ